MIWTAFATPSSALIFPPRAVARDTQALVGSEKNTAYGIESVGLAIFLLAMFNLIYALISTPAGLLSDRVGRRRLIIGGWLVYAALLITFWLPRVYSQRQS
jgi:MFS family permease